MLQKNLKVTYLERQQYNLNKEINPKGIMKLQRNLKVTYIECQHYNLNKK